MGVVPANWINATEGYYTRNIKPRHRGVSRSRPVSFTARFCAFPPRQTGDMFTSVRFFGHMKTPANIMFFTVFKLEYVRFHRYNETRRPELLSAGESR